MTREESALVVQVFEDFVKRLVIDGMTGEANDYFNFQQAKENLIIALATLTKETEVKHD